MGGTVDGGSRSREHGPTAGIGSAGFWKGIALGLLGLAALASGLACDADAGAGVEPEGDGATRRVMGEVRDALAVLLPVAVSRSPQAWEAADGSPPSSVRAALDALAAATEGLRAHGGERGPSFRFLSRALAEDARAIERRVGSGRYESASYLTERLTETCVACHVRLPARSAAPLREDLLAGVDESQLSPFARVRLQIATRQFDAALDRYESLFADPELPISVIELSDALSSYLILALRVRRDAQRADTGLDRLARRADLPLRMRRQIGEWRAALEELAPVLREPSTPERAGEILQAGLARVEFPADAGGRVHAIVASALLYDFLEREQPEGLPLAEALYLLARSEAFTRRSTELSEAEHYLATAIRTAPHSPLAARAYARLDQKTRLAYTGSAGENTPDDVRAWLDELRELSEWRP